MLAMTEEAEVGPLAAMRRSRPELFSDTEVDSTAFVAREVLDHHLETLTKRKQEYEFEHFARLLAEQELCPNLRPQTGPTGGGDSKVDAETYPVAEEVSERWYLGDAAAGSERWGFAFSAKAKWQPKVRSDVDGIVATGRGYARIYFVTSQYAPDKARSKLEDELTERHATPVTILDRSWILEKVYGSKRAAMAVEALGLAAPEKETRRTGPNDAARLRTLEILDKQIADPTRYRSARYSLAEDMLNAALAARGLGRDRREVDGRFHQAAAIAREVGVRDQRLRISYLHAWTTFWWFEDAAAVDAVYSDVEELALDSDNAADLQRLASLWQLLARPRTGARTVDVTSRSEERSARLRTKLETLAADRARPNSAFQAKVSLGLLDLAPALVAGDEAALDAIWSRLAKVVDASANHLNFSVEAMFELVQELGDLVPDSDAYEAMMDRFVAAIEQRRSDGAAGEANLKRGLRKLSRGKPYDAIRTLGHAELQLAKHEHVERFVVALVTMAGAYQEAGLLWAARTKLMFAVEQCFGLMRDRGDIEAALPRTLHHLLWNEIQLGRLPQALTIWTLLRGMTGQMELEEDAAAELSQDLRMQDAAIGILVLRANLEQLAAISALPDVLRSLDLPLARAASLWALGQEDLLRREYSEMAAEGDLQQFFERWADQPVSADMPSAPLLGLEDPLTMRSVVLGLEVEVRVARDQTSLSVAEALLSALEAFLATSLDRQVMPWREQMIIEVSAASAQTDPFATTWDETGPELVARVSHPPQAMFPDNEARQRFSLWLRDTIGQTVARAMIVPDAKAWLDEVAGEEQGFSRAITLGNVPILSESLFGDAHRVSIRDWVVEGGGEHELLRAEPWRPSAESSDRAAATMRRGVRDDGTFNAEDAKHSDRRVSSIIDMPLWSRADWTGTGSLVAPPGEPLVMGLAFRNLIEGVRIFEGWRTRFGTVDEDEAIRVAIVLGISRRNPAHYAVTIGRTIGGDMFPPGGQFISLTRFQRMEPATRENLDRFIDAFRREGSFLLAPMPMRTALREADFRTDVGILKRRLEIRQAWEIGPQDLDTIIIRPDDDPVLPQDGTVAPVVETLAAARGARRGFFASR